MEECVECFACVGDIKIKRTALAADLRMPARFPDMSYSSMTGSWKFDDSQLIAVSKPCVVSVEAQQWVATVSRHLQDICQRLLQPCAARILHFRVIDRQVFQWPAQAEVVNLVGTIAHDKNAIRAETLPLWKRSSKMNTTLVLAHVDGNLAWPQYNTSLFRGFRSIEALTSLLREVYHTQHIETVTLHSLMCCSHIGHPCVVDSTAIDQAVQRDKRWHGCVDHFNEDMACIKCIIISELTREFVRASLPVAANAINSIKMYVSKNGHVKIFISLCQHPAAQLWGLRTLDLAADMRQICKYFVDFLATYT